MTQAPRRHPIARRPAAFVRARAGFTLIEIMMVVALAGLMAASATISFGAVRRGRLRASATKVASAFRFAYVHALTTGRSTRVVFAMGENQVWVEDSQDAHVLDTHDPLRSGGSADTAAEIEEAARREATLMYELRPRAPRAEFSRPEGSRFRVRELEGAVFTRLFTPHEQEPRERGHGYVYFFAGGVGERAIVQLRGDDDAVYSVRVDALTGRAVVYDHAVEPPVEDREPADDDDEVDTREQRVREQRP